MTRLRPGSPRVRSGPFVFDHDQLELRRDDVVIPLQKQPAQLLSHLLRHRGQTVTVDDIAGVLWGDGRHVEVPLSVRYAVREIRRAFDDDARVPAYLETLPRKGYRWIASVDDDRPIRFRTPFTPAVRTAAAAVLAAVLGVIAGQGLRPTPALSAGAEMPRVVLTAFDSLHVLAHELVPDSIEGPLARTHAFLTPFPER